jgi:hypothetical protein
MKEILSMTALSLPSFRFLTFRAKRRADNRQGKPTPPSVKPDANILCPHSYRFWFGGCEIS